MGESAGRRQPGLLAGLLVALVVAAGCMGGGVDQGEPQQPRPQQTRQPASPGADTTRADGTTSVAEFKADFAEIGRAHV